MILLSILVIFLSPIILNSQIAQNDKINLPTGLRMSNQLEYSFDTDVEKEIMENWFNLDYNRGIFTTGMRFEVFQPNDPNPSVSRGKDKYSDIAYKYLNAKIGNIRNSLSVTVGNFYGSFGRGIIFKSYEDRNVRIDNNLQGVSLEARYSNFSLKALSGSAANIKNERKDILHAFDLEYRGFRKLKMGFSYASNRTENENDALTNLMGFRIVPNFDFMDMYTEYAVKLNKDIKKDIFNQNEDFVGRAFFTNLNFYYNRFSLVSEIKYYDNFNFTSKDESVQYNTAPAVIRDYSYILLNRHPHALNQNNEKGFQVEGNYVVNDNVSLTLSYGLTKTIGDNSLFGRVIANEQKSINQLKEMFAQINYNWNDDFKTLITLGYNEEATTSTENFTPIVENLYHLDERNSVRIIIEHQLTNNNFNEEKYFSDVLTLEYLHSPNLTLSFVGEMKTSEPIKGNRERKYWGLVQAAYTINEYIDLSILVGSRQAGNICIGGVCRYEPEFEGVELKMVTRLF